MNQMKKEELEITISDSDRIECAIRHIETAVDIDPWAVEIAVKAMKTQLSAEGTTFDLISRQAAIEAMSESLKRVFPEHRQIAEKCLKALPSAQPEIEERTEEFAQNVPKEDLISRKSAIDAVSNWLYDRDEGRSVDQLLSDLPSAQPERKKGKWIKLDMHAHLADHKCTACGQECYVPTCMGEPMYTYCPNCGADMREDQDG